MPTTYLFTTQELALLMQRSPAISALSVEQRLEVDQKISDSKSSAAQQLYAILLQERETYRQIQTEYLAITNKIMADFQNEITHLKTAKLRSQQANTEQKAAQAEALTIESLLKTLNN